MTWARTGETPQLVEPRHQKNHSALGFLVYNPLRESLRFYSTIDTNSILTDDFIFWLTELHRFLRRRAYIVWDNLPGHQAARLYFEAFHPKWFTFVPLPEYSPELNPVEQVWNYIKNHLLANSLCETTDELTRAFLDASAAVNLSDDLHFIFLEHSGLPL